MTKRLTWLAVVVLLLLAPSARAGTLDRGAAEADTQAAMTDGHYVFCSSPSLPLSRRASRLCPLASEIPACEGFAKACSEEAAPQKPTESPSRWSQDLAKMLSYLALGLVWVAVVAVVVAIVYAIYRVIKNAREDEKARETVPKSEAVVGVEEAVMAALTSDAEVLLRTAAGYAEEGKLDLALYTYLAAALRSLDDRGAIRIARHRTNGEYVRECKDTRMREPLRAMVRGVDLVRFGGEKTSAEALGRAAEHAVAIVRAPAPIVFSPLRVATMLILALLVGACHSGGVFGPGSDPAGDDLLLDMLVREGVTARHMTGALSSLPMVGASGPAVIVDTRKTPLDEETQAHLVAWVAQGGVLVLAGNADEWPKDFWAKGEPASGREVRVETPCPAEDDACAPPRIDHVRLASSAAMTWPHENRFAASAALETGQLYGAVRPYEKGLILGLASDDLLTNAGLLIHGNPSGLVALLESLDKSDFLVTRAENGMAPPSNPFAGMVRIGLGLSLAHALVFAVLLFVAVGARHARPVPSLPPPRRAFAEHVRATGALYARAQATGYALHAYAQYVDRELRARAPRGTGPALFLAQRAEADPKDTDDLFTRALKARLDDPPSGEDLLTLRRLSALFSKAMQTRR